MRLTLYTDYALRVMMFLAVRHASGALSRIDEIAQAYGISRSHLTKIVHELGQSGMVETLRGRAGGLRLSRPPEAITIGEIVRLAEKDFAVVSCHDPTAGVPCAIEPACHLRGALARATEAFLRELDRTTLAQSVTTPAAAAVLLGIDAQARPVRLPQPTLSRSSRRRP
ncbi:MAG: Rrf2 family transcriptional regulator [Burkholderiaceae bacterium]